MKFLLLLALACAAQSCALLYGIRQRPHDETAIRAFAQRYPHAHSIALQGGYIALLDSLCTDDKLKQNLFQPLQVHYLKGGQVVASRVNCFAKPGLTRLRWDANGKMDSYPPASDFEAKPCAAPIFAVVEKLYPQGAPDELIVVFWNFYMQRQSEELLRAVYANLGQRAVPVVLINNDSWLEE